MDTVYNVKYVDAHYTYISNIDATRLPSQEAYGYVEKSGNSIIICFIKKKGTHVSELIRNKETMIKGLIIPDTALSSVARDYPINRLLKSVETGMSVTVAWRDVRYIANLPIYECAVMQTVGELFRVEKDHIVIRDPKTVRTYPEPSVEHPQGARPTYLLVPNAFIKSVVQNEPSI